jgi:signal transduction histidine kinase
MNTSLGALWVEPDAICLRIDHKRLTLPIMKEQFDLMHGIDLRTPIEPAPLLLDFGSLQAIDRDAREFAAALLNPRWTSAVAMLCHNAVQRVIASFFRGLNNVKVPLAIACNKDAAFEALCSIRETRPLPAEEGMTEGGRLQKMVDSVSRMASGDFTVSIGSSDAQDDVDALACGIAMLAEETESLIENRRQAEAELLAMNSRLMKEVSERKRVSGELERINAELDGFAHTVTHDLKGPLSAIGAAARLIIHMRGMPSSGEIESNIEEMLWLLVHGVEKADAFIEETLSLAEAGQVPKVVCSVDIGSIVSRVIEEHALEVKHKKIRLSVDHDLGTVIANPTQMYQVFSNLICNAFTHNDSSKPMVTITQVASDGPGSRKYVIKDNGSGFPPEDLDRLFTPFFKGDGGKTGIGLSIVARIVEVYGGGVVALNDGGARFELTLRDFDESRAGGISSQATF